MPTMFVDSHCHLDFPELSGQLDAVLDRMAANRVSHALCVAVDLTDFPAVLAIARRDPRLFASVGVHPDYPDVEEPSVDRLIALADDPAIVAIGETGLDYYRLEGDLHWQRERFRVHIRAARACRKPLIIHTRAASADTIALMREEGAGEAGGVMHCFTETWAFARHALDLGFFLSFSGIVTFKNAAELQATAKWLPQDRLLIETDSPFLAPVPHRGKTGEPAFVADTLAFLAALRGDNEQALAAATSANFYALFSKAAP